MGSRRGIQQMRHTGRVACAKAGYGEREPRYPGQLLAPRLFQRLAPRHRPDLYQMHVGAQIVYVPVGAGFMAAVMVRQPGVQTARAKRATGIEIPAGCKAKRAQAANRKLRYSGIKPTNQQVGTFQN